MKKAFLKKDNFTKVIPANLSVNVNGIDDTTVYNGTEGLEFSNTEGYPFQVRLNGIYYQANLNDFEIR